MKKSEIMPCAATWLDPEVIILNEVSQREGQTPLSTHTDTHQDWMGEICSGRRTYMCSHTPKNM